MKIIMNYYVPFDVVKQSYHLNYYVDWNTTSINSSTFEMLQKVCLRPPLPS